MNRTLPKPPKVVDLHAAKIVDDWEDYSNDELLTLSIDRFRETLDAAIYWEFTEIRYIHGKGKGVLKKVLYDELNEYKADGAISRFYPAYDNPDVVVVTIGF